MPTTTELGGTGCSHHGIGAHAAVVADGDGAEDLGPGPDDHAIADRRVALLVRETRTPECHSLVDRHVVTDHRGLADDDTLAWSMKSPRPN